MAQLYNPKSINFAKLKDSLHVHKAHKKPASVGKETAEPIIENKAVIKNKLQARYCGLKGLMGHG